MRRLLAMLCLGALLLGGCTWRPDTTISYNWAVLGGVLMRRYK